MRTPPRIARWILSVTTRKSNREIILGDFEEFYDEIFSERGAWFANIWFCSQAFKSIPRFLLTSILWNLIMFRNYFKITCRNFLKQKIYTLITLSGLAIGLGVFLFFFRLFYWAETADTFHKDIDNIFIAIQRFNSGNEERHTTDISFPLLPALKNEIPEIENFTRITRKGKIIVSGGNKIFFENNILFVDKNFLSFFTFKMILGNIETILSEPNSIVLTQSSAEKYFGDASPIGQVLTLDNKTDVIVTGIIEDISANQSNSSIRFDFLVPLETAQYMYGKIDDWEIYNHVGFVKITNKFNIKQIEEKLEELRKKYFKNSLNSPQKIYLYPFQGFIHNAIYIQKFCGHSDIMIFTIFFIMGTLFLFIVIINYVNLATARYSDRLKEIGIRKVIGANKLHLFNQFLGESILMALLSLPLALIAYNFASSAFIARIGIILDLSPWSNNNLLFILVAISILTGFIAGIYPALLLSSFRSVQILKGKIQSGRGQGRLRKLLVSFQFTFSIILIVLALVWKGQTDFLYRVDLGYDRTGVITIPLHNEIKNNFPLMKEKFESNPDIVSVSASTSPPGNWGTKEDVIPEGKNSDNAIRTYYYGIEYDFIKTLNIKLVGGRAFSIFHNDEHSLIIDKLFAEELNWANPIGKRLTINDVTGTIIGVVENFRFNDTFFPAAPTLFYLKKDNLNYMLIKVRNFGNIPKVNEHVKELWNELYPNTPYESFTLEDYFDNINFDSTKIIAEIIGLLGLITIFFSCLGLLALASYEARKRTKEIGIRKILGASVSTILIILAKDFLKLILIANIIAIPIAYLISKKLIDFAFTLRMTIGPDIFIFTFLLTLIIALFTITTQTYKAAQTNPVDTLKYE
ncbi:MAG: hypothetical protein A2V66_07635 [Ignavibacteria bacterium RBG_13_36_8]|nr:MAG: hypothetical protein A2V66_07635 [Ignavibacteria bacterium RBG_13_36_8]